MRVIRNCNISPKACGQLSMNGNFKLQLDAFPERCALVEIGMSSRRPMACCFGRGPGQPQGSLLICKWELV